MGTFLQYYIRCMDFFWSHGIAPGKYGDNAVCRKVLRELLSFYHIKFDWSDWLEAEWAVRANGFKMIESMWSKHKNKSPSWWFVKCDLTEEDLELFKKFNLK